MPFSSGKRNRMGGVYILLIALPREETIPVGKLGPIRFPEGFYAYVGSAMNGLESRVTRHLRGKKKKHWHIDYLLEKAEIWEIIICETEEKTECALARALAEEFQPIPHFGSSDCQCGSHLYFGGEKCRLETKVIETMDEAGLAHRIFYSR